MRHRAVWICGLLLLVGLAGCGAAPDGNVGDASAVADNSGAMSSETGDTGPLLDSISDGSLSDDSLDANNLPEMATAADEPPPPPPMVDAAPPDPGALPSFAAAEPPASANDDWPVFSTRSLPSRSRSTYSAPAPMTAPANADALPAPSAMPSTESVTHVDDVVSRLDYGTVGFYTPTELPWGETFVQEVVLSPKATPEELRTALSNPAAPAEFSRLQVANRMEAKLTGSGFDIEPLSEPLQAITSHRTTKWRFKVTPVKTGPQELHLSLLAYIDIEGRDAPLIVETKDALIEVDITVPQRLAGMFQAHWKWLWAAVVVPTIGYLWRRKTGRKPPEEPIRHAKAA